MLFLADVVVPRTVDGPARTTPMAVAVDLTLLLPVSYTHLTLPTILRV